MVQISELKRFDVTEHLDSKQAIAEYLTIVLEENDPALLAAAVGDIAKARGMTQIACEAGVSRESLPAKAKKRLGALTDELNLPIAMPISAAGKDE